MKKFKTVILIFLTVITAVIVFNHYSFAIPADVEDLSNRKYFPNALEAIRSAEDSIYVVMYLVSVMPDDKESPAYKLVEELIKAHRRGVKVKVVLDYRKSGRGVEGQVSYYAYKMLKEAGIDVWFDRPSVYTHNKTMVIDGEVIVAGSANWSRAAIEENNETSFIIRSKVLAGEIIRELDEIKLIRESVLPTEFTPVPYILMKKNGVIQEMVRRHDERALDAYLFLLRNYKENPDGVVDINYEDFAEGLGLVPDMDREAYRRAINRVLRILDKRYGLVKFKSRYDRPFLVRLLDTDKPELVYKPSKLKTFPVPNGYWNFGCNVELHITAIMLSFYLC